jgi:cytochrome c-type biogenesis protein CcmH
MHLHPVRAVLAALWLLSASLAPAQERAVRAPVTDTVLEARVMAVAEELRCLVCQNESVAASQAELALDLRDQIRRQLAEGRSEADIRRFMVERYGDFVLYRPPLKASTVLLWVGPFLLLAVGLWAQWRQLRQQSRREQAPLSAAEWERARRLLGSSGEQP